jgi:hypothetical protein
MRLARLAAALILAVATVGCDGSSSAFLNSSNDSYLEAALGTSEITKFGPGGGRMASYDTLWNEPRRLNIQGYQLRQDSTCTLSISIREPQEGKTYVIGPLKSEARAIYTSATFPKNLLRSYSSSRANAGTLVLSRFDPKLRIVEGTFHFVVLKNAQFTQDPTTPDSLQVMNGRFRLGYDIPGPPTGQD